MRKGRRQFICDRVRLTGDPCLVSMPGPRSHHPEWSLTERLPTRQRDMHQRPRAEGFAVMTTVSATAGAPSGGYR